MTNNFVTELFGIRSMFDGMLDVDRSAARRNSSRLLSLLLLLCSRWCFCYFDSCFCDSYSFNVNASYGRLFCLSVSICFECCSPTHTESMYCTHNFPHYLISLPHGYRNTCTLVHSNTSTVCVDMQQKCLRVLT